ncbi:MAG: helix-turn-helix domain-containing protein [Candidatus Thermoplasmatota archaeon]|nr:helix-turn-helix domain-containing protein [Candidatus Thermoplasmatota archaeon]
MLTELTFRVAGRDNLVCSFTRMHPGTRIVINPLRTSVGEPIERALYTVQAPISQAKQLVEKHFDDGWVLVAERDESLSVEVSLRLPEVGPKGDPLHLALRMLGPDAFYTPLVVRDGYIHCTLVSGTPEGTRAFIELTKQVNKHLQPDTFQILHVGPWNPTPRPPEDGDLTQRQQDVLRLAVAMGYYEQPRGATLEDLAGLLGVSKAAVHKTLAAAENKVIKGAVGAV